VKVFDVIGFVSLGAGFYYWGSKTSSWTNPGDLFTYSPWTDVVLVFALLALGFYFAVVLS
jgi:hypothetical protein